MLTQYNDEQTFGYFRGFNITELFEYGKTNLELYETKLIEDDKKKISKKEEASEEGKEEPKEIIIPKFLDSEEIKKANENFRQTYPDFVNLCKHFIEGFLGMRAGIDIVNLEDVDNDNNDNIKDADFIDDELEKESSHTFAYSIGGCAGFVACFLFFKKRFRGHGYTRVSDARNPQMKYKYDKHIV